MRTRATRNPNEVIAETETLGERIADAVAKFGGSWAFITSFGAFMVVYVCINVTLGLSAWDRYPFILLNLVLSFQSAFATPIILMSQNRQGRISDRRNHLDLQINLLAEQENTEQLRLLRLLCEKAGVSLDEPAHPLEQATRPDDIVRQITEATTRQSANPVAPT